MKAGIGPPLTGGAYIIYWVDDESDRYVGSIATPCCELLCAYGTQSGHAVPAEDIVAYIGPIPKPQTILAMKRN